jgi:hypothetical protein
MCVPCLEQLQKTSALEKNKGKLICETVEIFAGCGGLLGCSKLVCIVNTKVVYHEDGGHKKKYSSLFNVVAL